ncbi:DUF5076 domain-containing protein [Fulvimonas soli]|jgi:hypothetical protein|uniref:DUF5076 domain-containing protein n=1 Tax=Fulvimonas soli TaxID=155197 RepID=UPI00111F9065|nr:DUF5076 domain-containing protein [Fulvimonas soli]TNY25400.1 hypothetical protein BV497_14110 [Fulvimonas soli]
MNERPIPEAALRDKDAVEMLRVWIAGGKLHCSMKVGMYKETMNLPEEKAWGIILADVARHLAHAMSIGYSVDEKLTLRGVEESFIKELGLPTSSIDGDILE